VNLLAITPGTSLKFGHSTGKFHERCLAYAFLRSHWGADVMSARARWIFWAGVSSDNGDERLRSQEKRYRPRIGRSIPDFAELLGEVDSFRTAHGRPTVRSLFDQIVEGLAWKREFPDDLWKRRAETHR